MEFFQLNVAVDEANLIQQPQWLQHITTNQQNIPCKVLKARELLHMWDM
jgi:hypothetical protein